MKVSFTRALSWGVGAALGTWLMLGLAQATGETVSTWFKQSNPNPVLVQGSDGTNAVPIAVSSGGAQTVGGAAADDAAASGNPIPMGCMFETTTDAVDNGDIARVNCSAEGAVAQGLYNGTAMISARQMVNAADSTGVGIAASGLLAQFDDTTPTTVTENQFGNLRMSANGILYVGGNVASGATDSGNPVKVGGVYNSTLPSNIVTGERADLQTDRNGNTRVRLVGSSLTFSDGVALSRGAGVIGRDEDEPTPRALPVAPYLNNGATMDFNFTCANSAAISVAAGTTTELVALTASQVIRVCGFVISGDTLATTAKFVYGTGVACGSGTTDITGAMRMPDEGSISHTGMNGSAFRTIASNALCITTTTGAVTGFVTYAKY